MGLVSKQTTAVDPKIDEKIVIPPISGSHINNYGLNKNYPIIPNINIHVVEEVKLKKDEEEEKEN